MESSESIESIHSIRATAPQGSLLPQAAVKKRAEPRAVNNGCAMARSIAAARRDAVAPPAPGEAGRETGLKPVLILVPIFVGLHPRRDRRHDRRHDRRR